jgi:hypothetical protein
MTREPITKPLEGSSAISDFGVGLSSQVARAKLLVNSPN